MTAVASVASWLTEVRRELRGPGVDIEYSVRLSKRGVTAAGRCTCWVASGPGPAGDSAAGAGLRRLLHRFGAPPSVQREQTALELPVRQGLGIEVDESGPTHRLYLHGRSPATLAAHYRSWRWWSGGGATASVYSFHFLPETASGLRPADLVPESLRPMLEMLLADDRLRQSSGFWIREAAGVIDQLDLAFPWNPPAGSLAGLVALAAHLGIGEEAGWRDLPVRHVALRTGPGCPAVTLYVSAPVPGELPSSETGLQAQARRGAADLGAWISESVHGRIPGPAPGGGRRLATGVPELPRAELDSFYGGDPATWRQVLGPRLHYHHALFDAQSAPGMDAALDRAVTELYPFIPPGGRLYDIGCGWGGALAMWIRDLRCPSLGLTISRSQFRYAAGSGLPVRWGDAEQTLPPGYFDTAVLLESLEHIQDKQRLLRVLRIFTGRLVMRVNCQDKSAAGPAFGGTMHMISSVQLRTLLETTGWQILHWRDRRAEALPSIAVWNSRVGQPGRVRDQHLDTLAAWTKRVLAAPAEWAAANPLIEVVCRPRPGARVECAMGGFPAPPGRLRRFRAPT